MGVFYFASFQSLLCDRESTGKRKPINSLFKDYKKMEDIQIQLDRIERNTLLAAKKVLTFEDVALITGLSRSYLYKLTSANQIPHYKPSGKQLYFDREEIESWLKQNRVATVEETERKATNYVVNGRR